MVTLFCVQCGHIDKDMSVTHRSEPQPPPPPKREEESGTGTSLPVPVHMTSLLCPLVGCHFWQACSVSSYCLRRTVLNSSGSVLCALLGLTANTVHSSVVGGFWLLFHTSQCEGGPRILRSILGQTKYFLRAPRIRQSLVWCCRVRCTGYFGFLGDDFKIFPCSGIDSGYMIMRRLRRLRISPVFNVEADSHGLAVQKTIVNPLLQYIDKVIDFFVQVQLVVRSCGKQSRSHSAARRIRAWTRSSTFLSWRRCRFPWSGYHRVSPVAVH